MELIPVSNSNRQHSAQIKEIFHKHFPDHRPIFFYTKKTFREYLIYETPELVIINFADQPKSKYQLLTEVYKDKWLNSAGIIAIINEKEEDFLNKVKQANIVGVTEVEEIETKLARILKIVHRNKNILLQRALQSMFTGEIAGKFQIDNDLLDVQVHANLIINFVYNSNYVDDEGKMSLKLVLQEMLINAVEHGNCDISFEEKTEITMSGKGMADLIKEKLAGDEELRKKKVLLEYKITNSSSWVRITDEGKGFDWREKLEGEKKEITDPAELLMHGRGINMTRDLCKTVTYNDKGNAVALEFQHNMQSKFIVPGFFESDSETHFKKGDTVFNFGEESNFLYYIASGKYQVLDDNNNVLTTLTSSDIFLGEMSFLLYNIRTASILTIEEGVLYRISKKNFVLAIKKLPYYSLMLCKILAKRLENVNVKLAQAKLD